MPDIEFDARKDAVNVAKHGISLGRAQDFDWSSAVIRADVRRTHGEPRFVATGPIDGRLHVLVYTPRGLVVRVIGLRKANAREARVHGQAKETAAH
jgi:uncharacterized DUF497 family protein